MRNLITYPVGLVLKAYMAYAFILIEREKRKEQRAEKLMKKHVMHTALATIWQLTEKNNNMARNCLML